MYGDGFTNQIVPLLPRRFDRRFDSFDEWMKGKKARQCQFGQSEEFTMLELGEWYPKACEAQRIAFQPIPNDDPKQRQPDITRAQGIPVELVANRQPAEEGLEKTGCLGSASNCSRTRSARLTLIILL